MTAARSMRTTQACPEAEHRHRHGGLDARAVPAAVHRQLLHEHQVGQDWSTRTRGKRRRSSGRRRRRPDTATSSPSRSSTAAATNTACRAPRRTSARSSSRRRRSAHEYSVHRRRTAGYRADQRQARDLAVPRVRSHAVRRAVLHLHHPAHRRAGVAARRAERLARHAHQHVHPDRLVGDDGDGVGVAEAERLGASTASI